MKLSRLVVVAFHHFLRHHFLDVFLEAVELSVEVVFQLLLQCFKLLLGILVVAFKFSHLAQVFQSTFRQAVVLEPAFLGHCPQFLEVGIRDDKLLNRSNRSMTLLVFRSPVGQHIVVAQVEHHVCHRVVLDFNVGFDASTVSHLATANGVEHVGEAVGHLARLAITLQLVVDGLYAPSARNIVFTGSEFQTSVVRQFARRLHESLAVSPCANDNSTVQVLKRTTQNLRSRSRRAVHQHRQARERVERFRLRLVSGVGCLDFAFRLHDGQSFLHEQVHNVHRFAQQSTAIATKVDDKTLRTLVLQTDECLAKVHAAILRELRQVDISHLVAHHARPRDGRQLDVATSNTEFPLLLLARALHRQHEGGSWFATQHVAHLIYLHALQFRVVNLLEHVAHFQSHHSSRHVGVGFSNDDGRVLPHTDNRTHTAILSRGHHLQFAHVLLGIVFRVRVKTVQHGINAHLHQFVRIEGIHIHDVQVAIERIEHVEVLCHRKRVVALFLFLSRSRQHEQ